MWKHPKSIGKNYFTHLFGAIKIALIFQIGALRCLFHAFVPDVDIECAQTIVAKVESHITTD